MQMFAGVVDLPLLLLMLPETHQHLTLAKLRHTDALAAAKIQEADAIDSSPPVFHAPWIPLK